MFPFTKMDFSFCGSGSLDPTHYFPKKDVFCQRIPSTPQVCVRLSKPSRSDGEIPSWGGCGGADVKVPACNGSAYVFDIFAGGEKSQEEVRKSVEGFFTGQVLGTHPLAQPNLQARGGANCSPATGVFL